MLRVSIRALRQWAAAAALTAVAGLSHAGVSIDFLYTTHGNAVLSPCVGVPACVEVVASGVANDWAGLASPIATDWETLVAFTLTGAPSGTLAGSWVYADTGPDGNSLLGSLSGTFTPLSATLGKGEIVFTIEDGTGIFSGATGGGVATAYLDLLTGNYTEAGAMSVRVVPEPASWALMLGGALLLGLRARRRRG